MTRPKLMDLARCRALMQQQGIDLLAPSTEVNIYFTSEFPVYQYTFEPDTVAFSLIPADASIAPHLLIPHNCRLSLLQFPTWITEVGFFGDYEIVQAPDIPAFRAADVYEAFAKALAEMGLTRARIAIEYSRLPAAAYEKLKRKLPEVEFVDGTELLLDIRKIKTPEEITRLKKSAAAAEKGIAAAYAQARPGMTELQLDHIVRRTMMEEGCTPAHVMVGTGSRGAFGPVYSSDAVIKKGDVIRIDAGANYQYYVSDICRGAVVGETSPEVRQVFAALCEAQAFAIDMVKPGLKISDLFERVVKIPPARGVKDFRRHHIGHGIGVMPHEAPLLAPWNDNELETGMVLCVETPYNHFGLGGFGPEDELIVTRDGFELITKPQKELIVI